MVSTPWIFANLLVLIIGVWLFAHYCLERKAINSFARKSIEGARDPTEEVLALSGIVYSMMNAYPHHQEDPHFVPLRWFFALGASPGAVLQKGGLLFREDTSQYCLSSWPRLQGLANYSLFRDGATLLIRNFARRSQISD